MQTEKQDDKSLADFTKGYKNCISELKDLLCERHQEEIENESEIPTVENLNPCNFNLPNQFSKNTEGDTTTTENNNDHLTNEETIEYDPEYEIECDPETCEKVKNSAIWFFVGVFTTLTFLIATDTLNFSRKPAGTITLSIEPQDVIELSDDNFSELGQDFMQLMSTFWKYVKPYSCNLSEVMSCCTIAALKKTANLFNYASQSIQKYLSS